MIKKNVKENMTTGKSETRERQAERERDDEEEQYAE
jgi:hypothetical protein